MKTLETEHKNNGDNICEPEAPGWKFGVSVCQLPFHYTWIFMKEPFVSLLTTPTSLERALCSSLILLTLFALGVIDDFPDLVPTQLLCTGVAADLSLICGPVVR